MERRWDMTSWKCAIVRRFLMMMICPCIVSVLHCLISLTEQIDPPFCTLYCCCRSLDISVFSLELVIKLMMMNDVKTALLVVFFFVGFLCRANIYTGLIKIIDYFCMPWKASVINFLSSCSWSFLYPTAETAAGSLPTYFRVEPTFVPWVKESRFSKRGAAYR